MPSANRIVRTPSPPPSLAVHGLPGRAPCPNLARSVLPPGESRVSLKLRLIVMNFLQFFVWGAWLITIGRYWFENQHWSGTSFGAIFSTMGISALFMPALMGVVA